MRRSCTTVAKVGGEDLAGLPPLGHEADRTARPVGLRAQLSLQIEQRGLGIDLECEGVQSVPLVAAAGTVLASEVLDGVEVGGHGHSAFRRS